MKLKTVMRTVSLTAFSSAVLMLPAHQAMAADTPPQITSQKPDSPVTVELKELRSLLDRLNADAEQLEKLPQSQLSFRNHAGKLNRVRDGVNLVGNQLLVLQTMTPFAEPWQQNAIAAILPVAAEVAQRTGAAIVHLNGNQNYLWAPDYLKHLRTIPALANDMSDLLDNHLKIVDNRENIQSIEKKLAERIS